jgi:ATP-dependent Clp protease ATP-binding subunit ClpC
MFERFSEPARQVVVIAHEEARGLQHNYIGTKHILVALLVEEGPAARALVSRGLTADGVRDQIARIVGRGDAPSPRQLGFTPRAKTTLERALREAQSLSDPIIGTEHILLGLVRENEGVGARLLIDAKADAENVRKEVMRLRREPGAEGSSTKSFDLRVVQLITRARARAEDGGRLAPDSGDLLLALVGSQDGVVADALAALDVRVEALRRRRACA